MKLLLLFSLIFLPCSKSFSQITFQKLVDTLYGYNTLYSVEETNDNGYIFSGNCKPAQQLLIKTDEFGDTIWTKTYKMLLGTSATSVHQTPDSGYIVGGFENNFGTDSNFIHAIKTDPAGNLQWIKSFGPSSQLPIISKSFSLITADSNYIMAGSLQSSCLIIKLNQMGDTIWTKIINDFYLLDLKEGSDNSIIILGHGIMYTVLLKINLVGNIILEKKIADGYYFGSAVETYSKDFILTLSHNIITGSIPAVESVILKLDSIGNLIWANNYSNLSTAYIGGKTIAQTSDSNIVSLGFYKETSTPDGGIILMKINMNGDTLWTRCYVHDEIPLGEFVKQTEDKGFIITGATTLSGHFSRYSYIIKTDSMGNSGCSEVPVSISINNINITDTIVTLNISSGATIYNRSVQVGSGIKYLDACYSTNIVHPSQNKISLYPNPSNGIINITSEDNINFIEIIDKTGYIIYQSADINNREFSIDLNQPFNGFYIVKLISGNKIYFKKIISTE